MTNRRLGKVGSGASVGPPSAVRARRTVPNAHFGDGLVRRPREGEVHAEAMVGDGVVEAHVDPHQILAGVDLDGGGDRHHRLAHPVVTGHVGGPVVAPGDLDAAANGTGFADEHVDLEGAFDQLVAGGWVPVVGVAAVAFVDQASEPGQFVHREGAAGLVGHHRHPGRWSAPDLRCVRRGRRDHPAPAPATRSRGPWRCERGSPGCPRTGGDRGAPDPSGPRRPVHRAGPAGRGRRWPWGPDRRSWWPPSRPSRRRPAAARRPTPGHRRSRLASPGRRPLVG